MTNKEYLELAEKVGLTDDSLGIGMTDYGNATQEIIDLCKQVEAHAKAEERERCAKVCNEIGLCGNGLDCKDAIRALKD